MVRAPDEGEFRPPHRRSGRRGAQQRRARLENRPGPGHPHQLRRTPDGPSSADGGGTGRRARRRRTVALSHRLLLLRRDLAIDPRCQMRAPQPDHDHYVLQGDSVRESHPRKGGMHALLTRQIRRHLGNEAIPEIAKGLLVAIDEDYRENDWDRAMLERALEISSQDLLDANSQVRAMLQGTPDIFLHVGIDGTVLDHKADPLIELFCSRAPEGEVGRHLVLKPEFFARFNVAIDGLIGGQTVSCFDVKPPGAPDRVFEVRIMMLFLDQAVIYIRDVTEQRAAEVQLRESEERYRSLFDSNPHPMWVYDVATLAFLAVNNSAVEHYGHSRQEFLAMTLKDIRPPDKLPALLRELHDIPENPIPKVCGVFKHCKKDGSELEEEIASSAIVFRGREAGIVLPIGVARKRRLEGDLEMM